MPDPRGAGLHKGFKFLFLRPFVRSFVNLFVCIHYAPACIVEGRTSDGHMWELPYLARAVTVLCGVCQFFPTTIQWLCGDSVRWQQYCGGQWTEEGRVLESGDKRVCWESLSVGGRYEELARLL